MVFEVENLKVNVGKKPILKGVDLKIKNGEIHAIMGPNGAGKSTLASAIMGNPKYSVESGKVFLDGENLLEKQTFERARKGVFLAMQYPAEIAGVTNSNFVKTATNSVRHEKLGVVEFIKQYDKAVKLLKMKKDLPYRYLNDGFSGGEKKRNEILQMLMLKPKLAILDEIDSGLDVDALKVVSDAINLQNEQETAFLIITHHDKILEYVKPDYVHILIDGKIVQTGGIELAEQIQNNGYDFWQGKA